ncbi:MAG: site-specific DNA-methyltransferase [Armatimonadetes bacterium]|nr:site-specific DNA-methyltransferase [Armatimonadota bacterium]
MGSREFLFPAANGREARIEIHCGDCLAGMAGMQPDSVDVVVTSPPYNLGIGYSKYDDTIPREQYLAWIGDWAAAVARVLSPDGSLFLNVGGKPSDPWVPFDVARRVAERGPFALQNTIHWIKSIALDGASLGKTYGLTRDIAVGHYKPVSSPRFLNGCHEYLFHFTHHGYVELDRLAIGVPYQDKSNIGRWKSARADRRCRGNTWFVPYSTIKSRDKERPHPATFPVELPRWCLRLHGIERVRRCLDPFLGLGSSAVAAAREGVAFIGFEIDEGYYEVAAEWLDREAKEARGVR